MQVPRTYHPILPLHSTSRTRDDPGAMDKSCDPSQRKTGLSTASTSSS